ncbi:MAG: hypothetical protein WEA09_09170 [Gemmatimonadota bacterium]
MSDDGEAERRFQNALQAAGARDPREFYRDELKRLRGHNPDAYRTAVQHYQEKLIPSIAGGECEPLGAWLEYGALLARLQTPGRTVAIDESGLATTWEDGWSPSLILHLPDDRREMARLVGLPPEPTPAQRAAYDLLVAGRLEAP